MAIVALPVDQRIIDIDSRRFASIEKALVELVTNSDDSYSRLEQLGTPTEGTITVGYERHDNGAVLTVTDQAEGMDLGRLESILSYGGAHSQLSRGKASGRGYFGRGLKQAVFGLGYGWIESVQDATFSRVDLFRTEQGSYVYDDQGGSRPATDGDRERLDLPRGSNGTRVTVVVDNPLVTLPYVRSLASALAHNIYLRDVLRRRTVGLVHANLPRRRRTVVRLAYEEPESTLLLGPDAPGYFTFEGRGHEFELTVRKAVSAELVLKGDERTNGLLVVSGTAVLDCQFFRYENQLGTEYLFGSVVCPGLVAMLASGRAVISDEREGLNLKEPFVAAFAAAVSEMVGPIIENERLRLSHVDHASTSKRTEGLIEQVLSRMNQVAVDDLGIVLPPGPGSGTYGPFPTGRPAALRFTTPFYFRPPHHDFRVALVVDRARLLDESVVSFTYDLPESITARPEVREVVVAELGDDGRIEWTLSGTQVGAKGRVRARCGPYSADCEVVIGARATGVRHHGRPEGTRTPAVWDQDNSRDMFVGYELRNLSNDIDRAVYDPEQRLVLINTEAPTVRLYIDGQGHFRDSARLLLAELLLDVIASELAHRYVDRTLQRGDTDAYAQARNVFVRRYGLEIHRILTGI